MFKPDENPSTVKGKEIQIPSGAKKLIAIITARQVNINLLHVQQQLSNTNRLHMLYFVWVWFRLCVLLNFVLFYFCFCLLGFFFKCLFVLIFILFSVEGVRKNIKLYESVCGEEKRKWEEDYQNALGKNIKEQFCYIYIE